MTYPQNSDPYAAQSYPPPAGYTTPAVNYASWLQRVGAYLIDALVTAPFVLLAVFLGRSTDETTGAPTPNALYFVFIFLAFIVQGYNRWYQAGKTGQTWGRKVLGIRLVGVSTGQPIGFGLAFVRDLAHIVDGITCYIGYLFPLWDAKKQTLADKIMSTVVVR